MQYHKIRDKELWNINDVGRCALCCQPVDHDNKRVILVQGGEGSAEIVRVQHRALHRFLRRRRKCHTFAARPIPSSSRPADICSAQTEAGQAGHMTAADQIVRSAKKSACQGGPSTYVFLDNARYHHAKLVREWLARPGRRIKLHFIPPYCPHLNPIERLWGLMHRNVTHNKCYATCGHFADATLDFLRDKVPKNWASFRDSVTDNFRVINPKDFRVLT